MLYGCIPGMCLISRQVVQSPNALRLVTVRGHVAMWESTASALVYRTSRCRPARFDTNRVGTLLDTPRTFTGVLAVLLVRCAVATVSLGPNFRDQQRHASRQHVATCVCRYERHQPIAVQRVRRQHLFL